MLLVCEVFYEIALSSVCGQHEIGSQMQRNNNIKWEIKTTNTTRINRINLEITMYYVFTVSYEWEREK